MTDSKDKTIALERTIHLGHLLGEGGMGRVVEGYAVDPSQHLAVKMLHPEHLDDAEVCGRFDEEIALMASIDHPGSLPIYGAGTSADGTRWYAMKKVEGRTLTELLAGRESTLRSLPERHHLLSILLDACETVASAHQAGIVHRDLKPDNILINRHDSVYVIDWGIARRVGCGASDTTARTLPGKVMGSPGYLAPEQAEGQSANAGPRADVFALGAILYEILTGHRPFGGMGGREEMLGAIHQDPQPPRRIDWLIPRSISAVCMKALEKDPARRYADAGALAADLQAHLEGRPVAAVRPNPLELVRYAARRRPMRALVVSSSVVAFVFLIAFIGVQRWADHRLADKAMDRIEVIDFELGELQMERENAVARLADAELSESERASIAREVTVIDSRWLLGQFDALRILSSVTELRFISTDSEIGPLMRRRLLTVIDTAIKNGKPMFAEALIANLLERHRDGTLARPLSEADVELFERLAAEASQARDTSD
ncbi:serine/threonine-protein kinase [Haloferula sp. A504]|uniref:serine/threonine-protein kinase n=1 Tax=Haloferula sp. A504 TaxID=3373601 RepID=UPI0031C820A7|nr:serine/threonine protein kinase [Verrucomicrobiaceae bacterium E54]